ncbi:MAG: elongation factor Ts [Sedimentisphaerales bacterium]|nr:elongation factor Ts [Sedimentisphaerales bacterium]
MAEISASMVVKLRKMSGQGMMDCKKALEESNGDFEQAIDILRKKGLATLAKRSERETTEGLVVITDGTIAGRKWVSIATLCCETDFVARSDPFRELVDYLVNYIKSCKSDSGPENILETSVNGKKYNDIVTEAVSKTGEKLQVCDYERYVLNGPGVIGNYLHFNGKVGSIVEIETNNDATAQNELMQRVAADIAMHITATKPLSLDKSGISAETIEREKAIFAEQIKNKPANIIDKIVEGKMKKFFAENCLVEQQFVKDDSKTVAQVLDEAAKQSGGSAKIKRYVRFEVG